MKAYNLYFQPRYTKILKNYFTIAVNRNAVIKLHRSGKSNVEIAKRLDMNRSTVWKIVKKFQKTGNTFDQPGRKRKRSVRSPQLPEKQEGNAATKPSPKLKNLGHRSRCEQIHHAPGIEGQAGGDALHAASPGATDNHVAMRGQKCRKILQKKADGTLLNLVFTDKKRFDIQQVVNQRNDRVWASSSSTERRIVMRRQNPQSVMLWAAVTETGKSPLLFVHSGVKLNSQRYLADILEGCLLFLAKKHFQRVPWFLQQDSAPSHFSKITPPGFRGKFSY